MFSYAWLIPLMPLLAFVAIVFFANRYRELSAKLAIGAMFISFILAMGVLGTAIACYPGFAEEPFNRYIVWIPVGTTLFRLGLCWPLAVAALAMVTIVCLMIFIYSQGYMHGPALFTLLRLCLALCHRYCWGWSFPIISSSFSSSGR